MKVTIEEGSVMVEGGPATPPGLSERDAHTFALMQAVVWAMDQLVAELRSDVCGKQTIRAIATAMRKP